MNGSDGKPFKTRDGGVMELRNLISMVEEVTYTKLKENIVGEERKELASKLAIAVLKYADLLPLRNTDYVFDVEKFSSLEGKTGPYILYTAVRINSIFSKLKEKRDEYKIKGIYSDEELNIYLKLVELTKTIDNSFSERTLSYICDYLFNLANLYNKFYNEHNIINEENKDVLSFMKDSLTDQVVNVRLTNKLSNHPVCLTTEGEISVEMQKVINALPNNRSIQAKTSLEINENHAITEKLKTLYENDKEELKKYAKILYAQAKLIEGLSIDNPTEISNLICDLISK